MDDHYILEKQICPVIAPRIAAGIEKLPSLYKSQITEIRLRTGLPVLTVMGITDSMLTEAGNLTELKEQALICSHDDLQRTLQIISRNSLYAFEEELRSGFITIQGGHRIGVAGQALLEDGHIKTLKNISSLNIRIARQVLGCAKALMPYLVTTEGNTLSTLIISPPRSGKTTLLRDIARYLSTGLNWLKLPGWQVGIVDERSEIGACRNGIPTMDVGPRTDILDGCPKAVGMLMLIRSMSPQVIITDELGRAEDCNAVREALHSGVTVIASVHGKSHEDIKYRPFVGELVQNHYFERYVVLSDRPHPGTVARVIAASSGESLYCNKGGVRICG
ncbi:stage III sporulation protein AA [Anaerospora sp.]|uniref:stage III sporulation protein AA n=1 Tax=Anaerospora sp. TaxID=1960278 RepID=UPI0028A21BEB|nr:stage III sporulation protein AA [Anaerospora sp.]